MTPEAQRIAIAEACGYERRPDGAWRKVGMIGQCGIPDYLNDLNACAEFEKTLLPDDAYYSQRTFYAAELGRITGNDNGRGWKPLSNDDCFAILHATAAQRCEAFLKTLELWTP